MLMFEERSDETIVIDLLRTVVLLGPVLVPTR